MFKVFLYNLFLILVNCDNIIELWSNGAYDWFYKIPCENVNFLSNENCINIKKINKTNIRIYAAPFDKHKYATRFPDATDFNNKHKVAPSYDAILILDPFPASRFAHPVIAFQIQKKQTHCNSITAFITGDGDCMEVIQRKRCNNYRSKFLVPLGAKCETVFLPLVYFDNELPLQINNRLTCYSNLNGFNDSCAELRPISETTKVSCDPLLTNSNCDILKHDFTTGCSPSHICDHAVLISGGWNRQLSDRQTFQNLIDVRDLLKSHGFLKNYIKIFYANGVDEDALLSATGEIADEPFYPSSMKNAMRNHIRTICDSEYCADSLILYMNSPTRVDGASLLWDAFGDGLNDDWNTYTTKELMRDISHCKAKRVIIMADQNYVSSFVATAEARFTSLENVVIFGTEFDQTLKIQDYLTRQLLRAKYTDICLNDFADLLRRSSDSSSRMFIGQRPGLLNSTLVGGPCTSVPSFLNDAHSYMYRGCQSTPLT